MTRDLVLVAGLPRAGKSTLAEALCAAVPDAAHLPLDKYIAEVPAGVRFLDWVQRADAIDWHTLGAHLEILRAGRDCYTPALDWRGGGKRLCEGGAGAWHARARLVRGGASVYVVPGCFAFEMPPQLGVGPRIFVDTPAAVIATRMLGRTIEPPDAERALEDSVPGVTALYRYRAAAEIVVDGARVHELDAARLWSRLAERLHEEPAC